ncbi:MAG TPA: tetratricopeptide repeat protein [Casimicrobiaceae bacterium]
MTFDRYAQWLSRGRSHQAAGRTIDALLCYRRALREAPQGIDAQFHAGEIAWHMGNRAEAVAAWRSASARSPSHLPSWHALADALATQGELDASREAASRVLALRPDRRATKLLSLLDAARGNRLDASIADIVSSESWPLPLLAAIVSRASSAGGEGAQALPALLDAAYRASVTRDSVDALRTIALALAKADGGATQRFADRYAEACLSLYRPPMPLLWPRRTAGDALRIGVLIEPGREDKAAVFRANIARAGLDSGVECTLLASDEALLPFFTDEALVRAPDAAARAVAALDLDILVDLAGVRLASGPLLALHPARETWCVADESTTFAHTLADRAFDSSGDWTRALAKHHAALATVPACSMNAAELASSWQRGVRAHQAGDLAAARSEYERVLDEQPGHAPALYLTGALARSEGDADTARERFRAAIREAPAYVDARVALVTSLIDAGGTDEAVAVARDGLDLDGTATALWRALGQAELARGDAPAAVAAFEQALARDATDGEAHYNHGVALQSLPNLAEGARAYQRALALSPDLVAAHFNLGVIFDQQGNADAAIAAFSNVLARAPSQVAAYKALAETLLASGRIDAWFANFERFERHCPGHLSLAVHALEVCAYRGDFAKLGRYLDGLREGRFTAQRADETLDALQQLLYLLHFFDVEPDVFGRYARTHDALSRKLYGEPLPRRAVRTPGTIRIGYLSGDLRNHVMGKMMLEALRHHDRVRFDVIGYATSDARDDWTPRFEQAFARLTTLGGLTDAAAAQRIADDDLDVLVDLSTHTKGARPGILARKPARVQITHVASAGTLAMSAIDFKLTDRYADSERDEAMQIEPPLVMSGCVYPYRHIEPVQTAAMTRATLRIADGAVVIGAFVTPLKLSQRCLALWRDVMTRIPNALLAFSPLQPGLRGVFERLAGVAGIAPQRLVFVPQGRDDAENQARYRVIDFVLDPMPYGGVNGTLEALDMGVPVVTLVGRRHAERTSFSILTNLGVTDTIAQTGADYVDIAVRLATDRAFMQAVRARFASGLRASALTDMAAHTRHLEAAYLAALEHGAPEALAGG